MPANSVRRAAASIASLPLRLFRRRPLHPPQKALILKPCCISEVMQATPLLAVLSEAYPQAQFDWAVSDWARPAIASNPRLSELISTGRVGLPDGGRNDTRTLIARLQEEQYDTCFIPDRSGLLGSIARRAAIPQRIGLNTAGVNAAGAVHQAERYLALARPFGIEARPATEFFPSDTDRAQITERLVDEIDWLGDVPLVIMHPGGAHSPLQPDEHKRWPPERFALLGNHLVRRYSARILLVGAEADRPLATTVAGLMPTRVMNLAGRLTLGGLGALCEVADLYIGNDTGPTHVAAAVGCPTLVIFGPGHPEVSGPYGRPDRVAVVGGAPPDNFSWAGHVLADEAAAAADQLLAQRPRRAAQGEQEGSGRAVENSLKNG